MPPTQPTHDTKLNAMTTIRRTIAATLILLALLIGAFDHAAHARIDEAHRQKAKDMAAKAVAWLRAQQDQASGGWGTTGEGPKLPAITGLALTGILLNEDITPDDQAINAAVRFILSFQKPDGSIHDGLLPSYNTAVCLSALAMLRGPETEDAIKRAVFFIRGLQYGEDAFTEGAVIEALRVGPDHPFYGGIGYGRHGRPDLSNLSIALQALHDAGIPGSDAAFQRALVFLARTQMLGTVNDMDYARGSRQGGFIYATAENSTNPGVGQSFAGMIEETIDHGPDAGKPVSRLRAYGSMTYAGFKSLIYADLPRDDPRIIAAHGWITHHYTLAENPGLGPEGLYYYLSTFARAMHAWSGPGDNDDIEILLPDGTRETRDWANDLIDRLAELQNPDGSFRPAHDRWMEHNPTLITAYALIALGHATR